jgi:hypothetical protein
MGKFAESVASSGFRGKGKMISLTDEVDPGPVIEPDPVPELIDGGSATSPTVVVTPQVEDDDEDEIVEEVPNLPEIPVDKPVKKRVKKKVRVPVAEVPQRGHACIRRR